MGNRKYHKNTADAGTTKYFDYSLLFIIIFLVLFGLVMLYSVSAYEGQDVFNDPFHYLKRQAGCAFLGFIGMFIVSVIPCEWWKKLSFPSYVLSFLMCAAVIVVGKGSNGSTRWLKIGPIQLQPSEIAKIAVIIFMAALLSRIPKQVKDLKSIIKVLLFVLPMVGVIAVSNLSTAIIVGGIAVLMIFVVSPKTKEFFVLGAGLVALGAIGVKMGGYRVTRIAAWAGIRKTIRMRCIKRCRECMPSVPAVCSERDLVPVYRNLVMYRRRKTTLFLPLSVKNWDCLVQSVLFYYLSCCSGAAW